MDTLPTIAQSSTDAYLVFCSAIDQASTQRIFNAFAVASQNDKVNGVHLFFQSTGGFIGDGIALYNFFRTFKKPFTIYNMGQISSIAAIAYLAADTRMVNRNATFMLHRPTKAYPAHTSLKGITSTLQSLQLDDQRLEAILRKHLILTDEQWAHLTNNEFWFTAEDAVKSGIATQIGDFSPPLRTPFYNI